MITEQQAEQEGKISISLFFFSKVFSVLQTLHVEKTLIIDGFILDENAFQSNGSIKIALPK